MHVPLMSTIEREENILTSLIKQDVSMTSVKCQKFPKVFHCWLIFDAVAKCKNIFLMYLLEITLVVHIAKFSFDPLRRFKAAPSQRKEKNAARRVFGKKASITFGDAAFSLAAATMSTPPRVVKG